MSKRLEDAIGCWTTNPDGLLSRARGVTESVKACALVTRRGKGSDDALLMSELELLQRRVESLDEIVKGALKRIREIVSTDECGLAR
jgi:hypothetical protein